MGTYNLAFFLGPGLPLTFGAPSGPRATPELLFTPFFFGPSVGGGIDDGAGVLPAAGVFEVDSDGLSPFELSATGRVFDVVDEESFNGDSSLMATSEGNFANALGESFKVTINEAFDDLRRAVGVVVGLFVDAIVRIVMRGMRVRKFGRLPAAGEILTATTLLKSPER